MKRALLIGLESFVSLLLLCLEATAAGSGTNLGDVARMGTQAQLAATSAAAAEARSTIDATLSLPMRTSAEWRSYELALELLFTRSAERAVPLGAEVASKLGRDRNHSRTDLDQFVPSFAYSWLRAAVTANKTLLSATEEQRSRILRKRAGADSALDAQGWYVSLRSPFQAEKADELLTALRRTPSAEGALDWSEFVARGTKAAAQLAQPSSESCRQLQRRCLALAAAAQLHHIMQSPDQSAALAYVPELVQLLRAAQIDPLALLPDLDRFEGQWRTQALAQLIYFGGIANPAATIDAALAETSANSKAMYMYLPVVAIQAAAAGRLDDADARIRQMRGMPSMQSDYQGPGEYLALKAAAFADQGRAAESAEFARSAVVASRSAVTFLTLRQLFRICETLARQGAHEQLETVLSLMPDENHRIVAEAYAAQGRKNAAQLRTLVTKGQQAATETNYPLQEIAVIAARMGEAAIAQEAVRAMTQKFERYAPVIALSAMAKAGSSSALAQAQIKLDQIPDTATTAVADARIAIAEAMAAAGSKREAFDYVQSTAEAARRLRGLIRLAGFPSALFYGHEQ